MATLAQNKIRIRLKAYDHSRHRDGGEGDRRDGDPHRRDRVRARAAADREERLLRDPLARSRTRTRASTSRSARTSG